MDWSTFLSTLVWWMLAAWLLPLIAKLGQGTAAPEPPPTKRQHFWPTYLRPLWLIFSSFALIFGAFRWAMAFESDFPIREPLATSVARFLGIFLVVVGLYTQRFLAVWTEIEQRETRG